MPVAGKRLTIKTVPDMTYYVFTTTTAVLRPFFRDHPGEPVPEENLWILWCKGKLTGRHTNHPAGCHSIRTNQCPPPPSPPYFTDRIPSCRSTNSVKALKATDLLCLHWDFNRALILLRRYINHLLTYLIPH